MDLSSLVVIVLFAAVLLRVAIIGLVIWLLVPRRLTCPHCAEPPLPLVSHRLLRVLGLERRWCYACSWSGISKRARRTWHTDPAPPPEPVPREADEGAWRPRERGDWQPPDGGGGHDRWS